MRLLIVTQVVDEADPVLGFFVRWIEECARTAETVQVICLKKGAYHVPSNVSVYSLGKEERTPGSFVTKAFTRLHYICLFYRHLWTIRNSYDAVFVHMNPEYVLLAGWYWKFRGTRIGLWYMHRSTPWYLRWALPFVDVVFSGSKESFRIPTKKLRILGHGIDIEQYKNTVRHTGEPIRILTTGRISASKRVAEMIEAVSFLPVPYEFALYGAPITEEDRRYEKSLTMRIQSFLNPSSVQLCGAISHTEIAKVLQNQSVFLNLSETGSLDKAVLEALAAGIPVVTSNPAFKTMLEPYGLFVSSADPKTVSAALIRAVHTDIQALTAEVARTHSLTRLIPVMLKTLIHG
jgi:glycosyltransferase involved in cell wall biosynthesis